MPERTVKVAFEGEDRSASRTAHQVESALGGIESKAGLVTGLIFGIGTAMAALPLGIVGAMGFGFNDLIQKTELAYKTLLGGEGQAKQRMRELVQFAAATPFELPEILQADRLLQTFGVRSVENLTLVGDAAAGVSTNIADVAMWFGRAATAIQAGRPFGEAAQRLQELGLLGGPARQMLEDMQKAGASSTDIMGALTGQLGKYQGLMEEQSHTWSGLVSTLTDTTRIVSATLTKPMFDRAVAGMQRLVDIVSSPGFTKGLERAAVEIDAVLTTIGDGAGVLTSTARALFDFFSSNQEAAAGLAAGLLVLLTPALISVAFWAAAAAVSFVGLTLAMLTNPLFLAAVAAGLLAAGLVVLVRHWDEVSAAAGRFASTIPEALGAAVDFLLSLPRMALEAGVAIARGIAQGIAAAASEAYAVAGEMVRGLITILNPFNWVFGSTMEDVYGEAGGAGGEALMTSMKNTLASMTGGVVGALTKPLEAFRQIVGDLQSEMQRLLGLPTREGAAEGERMANLRLEASRLEERAAQEKERREKRLALLHDQASGASGIGRQELDAQIKALEKQRGPAEQRLQQIDDEIEKLDRLNEQRRLEREILLARGEAADRTLATDAQVLDAMTGLIPVINTVTGAIASQASTLQTVFIPAWQDAGGAAGAGGAAMGAGAEDAQKRTDAAVAEMKKQLDSFVASLKLDIWVKWHDFWVDFKDALPTDATDFFKQLGESLAYDFGISVVNPLKDAWSSFWGWVSGGGDSPSTGGGGRWGPSGAPATPTLPPTPVPGYPGQIPPRSGLVPHTVNFYPHQIVFQGDPVEGAVALGLHAARAG